MKLNPPSPPPPHKASDGQGKASDGQSKKIMNVKQKKLPKSQIEIEFELTAEEFKEHFEHALEHLKKHVKVDGFRPGKAPNNLVEDKIKPESLLMEAGDIAVRETYTKYVKDMGLETVGNP